MLSKPRDGCLGSGFWKFLPITHHSTAHSMDCKKQSEGRTFVQHCKCTSLVPNPLSAIHNRLVLCHHISSHTLSNIPAAHTELRRKKIKPQFLFCLNLVFKPGIFRSKKKARDFCWKQLFSSGGCFFLFFSSFWIYFLARTPLLFVKKNPWVSAT